MFAMLLGGHLIWPAAAQVQVTLAPESQMWIEGRSTVDRFTCATDAVEGRGMLASEKPTASLFVPVTQFDCGKARMNQDMYDALKADMHPTIRFTLGAVEAVDTPSPLSDLKLHVAGYLTIAGTVRQVALEVRSQPLADGRYRATGALPLKMTDFGIEPPTALLGLVRAHDDIVVRFDLVAVPSQPKALYNHAANLTAVPVPSLPGAVNP